MENQTLSRTLPRQLRHHRWLGRLIGRRFDHLLDGIRYGQLSLTWPDGHTSVHGEKSADPLRNAQLTLHNYRPIRKVLLSGENGFAESYLMGDWSSDNLRNLFTLIVNNETALAATTTGSALARLINTIRHACNHNSLSGSRRNIRFHYDLGNAFYQLWLDKTMCYSAALFKQGDSLEQAQQRKLQLVLESLSCRLGSRVLEIGCGWGAMAYRLATQAGAHVEGISLSREQLQYASQHNCVTTTEEAGDKGSTEFRYQDYRDVVGQYDHIVSIEMFEAVGEKYWTTYFTKLAHLLRPGGTALLQVITIDEERFDEYRASPDFIQRYIFPGGMLPTRRHLDSLAAQAGFNIERSEWFGAGYARTLQLWRERFDSKTQEVLALGFDDRFLRMWRYYLDYCETGFRLGRTDVGQVLLRKCC